MKKVYTGPLEGKPIGALNRQRLRDLIENQTRLQAVLDPYLENTAIALFIVRAKSLLARGTYGNFSLSEMNAHLPALLQAKSEVDYLDIYYRL